MHAIANTIIILGMYTHTICNKEDKADLGGSSGLLHCGHLYEPLVWATCVWYRKP